MKKTTRRAWAMVLCATALAGCSIMPPGAMVSRDQNADLVQGPPIEDVVTPFDEALSCLQGKIQPGITFGVGQIVDATGKETYADGGTGKFVTQGAGEMVQSALFRAGVTVVNRRDPNIMVVETQWGIRDLSQQMPVNFFISGSINSLDFIPGGGFSAQFGGAGPRMRQNRILVALDLSMTDAMTGRIVASVPLQKQIFSRELGASLGRFFGETLVSLDMGGQEREALHFAMRQMLSFATFELLGQVMNASTFAPCKQKVSPFYGAIENIGTGDPEALRIAQESSATQQAARQQQQASAQQQAAAQQQRALQQQAAQQQAAQQRTQAARSIEEQVKELANHVMVFGARAVAAAEESLAAQSTDVAAQKSAEATELLSGAVQILQRAAELGLDGPQGDAAAMVVERAMDVVGEAQQGLSARMDRSRSDTESDARDARPPQASEEGAMTAPSSPPPSGQPRPGTPEAQRMGITE